MASNTTQAARAITRSWQKKQEYLISKHPAGIIEDALAENQIPASG